MKAPEAITVLASAARTASGTGASLDLLTEDTVRLYLDVTAVSGSNAPTLSVFLEHSRDDAHFVPLGEYSPRNAASSLYEVFAPCFRYVRARWAVDGTTPSFTFGIAGEKQRPLAHLGDLVGKGAKEAALKTISSKVRDEGLMAACESAMSRLCPQRYTAPLVAWGADLRSAVAKIAAWEILSTQVGFSADSDGGQTLAKNRDDAVAWLRDIANNNATPSGIVDSTPDEEEGEAYIVTRARRGWHP